ncbi:hypothetical protein M404DRAFT_29766, partial [Pisolithus tinctorius Marx 270]
MFAVSASMAVVRSNSNRGDQHCNGDGEDIVHGLPVLLGDPHHLDDVEEPHNANLATVISIIRNASCFLTKKLTPNLSSSPSSVCLLVPWHALVFTTLRKPDWKPLEKVAGGTMQDIERESVQTVVVDDSDPEVLTLSTSLAMVKDAKDELVAYAPAPRSFVEGILGKYIDSMPDDSDDELTA